MIKIPELLAPAGGITQLKAAVENGANAVYIGGMAFNARINAENFTEEDIKHGIEYAHIRGANVYITMNTLVTDREMDEALEHAYHVYREGADAIIVQDIGFAKLLKDQIPNMPLHLSTQSTIYNLQGVLAASKLGFKRVVLARELSLKEIKSITDNTNTEIEAFVHGSLCISYSGQCQLSNINGGRSGNRGQCAQPCRLPYSIIKTEGSIDKEVSKSLYLLSPKDLCTIDNLEGLIESGVTSLKIEGRMKSAEYVAVVTGTYRKYLDMYAEKNRIYNGSLITDEDRRDLAQVFNRGGFTSGYLLGKPGKEILSGDIPKHQGVLIGKVISSEPARRFIDIELTHNLSLGDGVEIRNKDLPGNVVTYMKNRGVKCVSGEKGDILTIGDIDGIVKPGDEVYKITDKELMKRAQNTYLHKPSRKVSIDISFTVTSNKPAILSAKDDEGNAAQAESALKPEAAINRPLTKEIAIEQLQKTGGTPFEVRNSELNIEEGLSVPVSEINRLRREVLDKMEGLRANKNRNREEPKSIYSRLSVSKLDESQKLNTDSRIVASGLASKSNLINKNLYFYELGDSKDGNIVNKVFEENLFSANSIYLPYQCFLEARYNNVISKYIKEGIKLIPVLPSITKGFHDENIKKNFSLIVEASTYGLCIGNIGWVDEFIKAGVSLIGDYGLNVYNSETFVQIKDMGFIGSVIAYDASLEQASKMDFHGLAPEWTIFGRIPAMISEYCAIEGADQDTNDKTEKAGCSNCATGKFSLEDRKGDMYPVIPYSNSCRMTILSHIKKQGANEIPILKKAGMNNFRINIYDESKEEIELLIK
jgi:U32 family peptidase